MGIAISAEGLCKRYGNVEALKDVDLTVDSGTVFGVLGPNGAGKTTLVRMLATLLEPDAGSASIAGFDVVRQAREVRKRIGLTGQYAALDGWLTGRENLTLIGTLYHIGRKRARERTAELLERFDLVDAADRPVRTYSGGMRRRLDLAASLMARPPVLFLDEPTTGLDLVSRAALWDMVKEQVAAGVTVLLTTQYLEEADYLADRIAVIDKGGVVAEGAPDELKRRVGGERLEISVSTTEMAAAAIEPLTEAQPATPVVDDSGLRVSVALETGVRGIAAAANALERGGIDVVDFVVRRPSLDDVFLELTGNRRHGDGARDVAAVANGTGAV
ncbi:ATP-binding cassette domain-containing protein [Amycolatopsis cihanbeyliensis]|uniref:ABC-2 type transport system ATP-binding protein n=1 Tax=Amycolatopsis cihanbeyliensis TaxID=1128664 RepID=A0A542DE53_AMYCI|nr:ATP-binding cassette domain-containing protein [Amycolatopsis cihanbeyliensis]TQJ01351.1 ABC-2 type transport system ATP-binding protein [Amycolatopsis cihanbeyliensis]